VKNTRLERYLNSATQGIMGKKRAQIQEELRGNLEQRAKELMAFGTAEKSALEQALNEFGAPKLVSRGMTQLYTLPWVNRTLGFGGILAATFATALLTSAQNVRVELVTPKYKCYYKTKEMCDTAGVYINIDSLVSELKISKFILDLKKNNALDFKIPLKEDPNKFYTTSYQFFNGYSVTASAFRKNGENYLDLRTTVDTFLNAGWPIKFNNLINPSFTIGDVSLNLIGSKNINVSDGISRLLAEKISSHSNKINGSSCVCLENFFEGKRLLKFFGQPRKMYALISFPFDSTDWSFSAKVRPRRVTVDVAQADANGLFMIPTRNRDLKFLSSFATFKEGRVWNTAIILPLTGRLDKDQFDEKHPLVPENVELPAARLKEVQ
jgi:hypothetical protein